MRASVLLGVLVVSATTACADRETLFGPVLPPSPAASAGAAAHVAARPTDALPTDASPESPSPAATTVDPDALVERARASLEARDLDAAEAQAREAIHVDDALAEAYVVVGDVALARQRPADALAAFERASALDPNDGWTIVRASEALGALGRPAEGRDRLRAFVAGRDDAGTDVLDALGWAELDAHDRTRARSAFTRALDASVQGDADAWYGLAVLASDAGEAREAGRALARLLAIDPGRRAEVEKDEAFDPVRGSAEWRALFPPASAREAGGE